MAKTRISASVDERLLEEFDEHVERSRSETLESAMRIYLRSVRDSQVAACYAAQSAAENADEAALAAASTAALAADE